MIKNIKLAVALLFALHTLHGQNYLVSFEGTGSATNIDSILVQNLTQATNLTVLGGNQLRLVLITGINTLNNPSENCIRVFPNPSNGFVTVEFDAPANSNATIEISNVDGKRIIQFNAFIGKGYHAVNISHLNTGMYAISIKSEHYFYSGKILVQSPVNHVAQVECSLATPQNIPLPKSTQEEQQMQYNDGDLLLFRAFSENYITVSTLIPTQDTTVIFNFVSATDFDGNNYGTLKIGSQIWLAENIKTTHYSDGNPIPLITDNEEWASLGDNNTDKAYCWYNNSEVMYKDLYGALYTYAAATNGNNSGINVQGVCPDGWHLPGDNEWADLNNFLAENGFSGNEGIAVKATLGWFNPGNGTNNFGFTALPGGYRSFTDGAFDYESLYGYWWSNSESGESFAWNRYLAFSYPYIGRYLANKSMGFSVRCIKD